MRPTPTFYACTQGPPDESRLEADLEPDERYVQSSRGPWRIDLDARYVLADKGREAIR